MAEVKKTTPKKKTTTSKSSTTTKNSGTTPKKTSTTKKTTTKPKTTTTKPKVSTTKKKPTTVKPKTSKPKPKTTSTKSTQKPKTSSKAVKLEKSNVLEGSKPKKITKPSTTNQTKKTKKKATGRVKKKEELTTLEVVEQTIEGKEIIEKKPLGKTFYLLFSILFFVAAFFYINNIYFNDGNYIKSALFGFAALFVVFVLILFNIHKGFLGFFLLPLRRMLKQVNQEVHKEIFFSVGKNKMQTTFNKYRTIITLVVYVIIALLLGYATVVEGVKVDDEILRIIMSVLLRELLYIVVLCSWQYLFNILPGVLDETIDAKNGYILTLSAIVMIVFVLFNTFNITYLGEIMIFILVIGFIALLGVNLNMIVGEINIFNNLRNKRDKTVTRLVFTIFFSFHIYVILYASVVAYSIYLWDSNSFNFSEKHIEETIITDIYTENNTEIIDVYYYDKTNTSLAVLNNIYDINGLEITNYIDSNNHFPTSVFDSNGNQIHTYYTATGQTLDTVYTEDKFVCTKEQIFYNNGQLNCLYQTELAHEYGSFLYWTVISVSTIGYGDISPSTDYPVAMAWGGFLGLYGLTFFALSISFVSNIAMEGYNARKEE